MDRMGLTQARREFEALYSPLPTPTLKSSHLQQGLD